MKIRANKSKIAKLLLVTIVTLGLLTTAAAYYFPLFFENKEGKPVATINTTNGNQFDVPSEKPATFNVPGGILQSDGAGLRVIPLGHLVGSALQALRVPIGKTYSIELVNGIKIFLDADSRLLFSTLQSSDTVFMHLEGEGYVTVGSGKAIPFTMSTKSGRIQTSGASFNINTYDSSQTVISVVSGEVKFYNSDTAVNIKQGKEYVAGNSSDRELHPIDKNAAVAWTNGYFSFYQKDFGFVTKLIERVFGIPVVLISSKANGRLLTGNIDKKLSLDQNLQGLQGLTNFTYVIKKDTLYITEK
jgi:ferric-dicitrate binding protein FerR (iron transport regulator)